MKTSFVHRFLPAAAPDLPTLLALHGTGGDENDLLPVARLVAPGAGILSPRGRVLENGMPRFFRRLAEGVFDQEDLRARTIELAGFVEDASRHYQFDPGRVVALGFSNGANIAASLLLLRPATLQGAILLRPMVPFEPETPPDLQGRRVLISAGRHDALVPAPLTERLADILRQAHADVEVAWYDTGHSLLQREIERAARWFAGFAPGTGVTRQHYS